MLGKILLVLILTTISQAIRVRKNHLAYLDDWVFVIYILCWRTLRIGQNNRCAKTTRDNTASMSVVRNLKMESIVICLDAMKTPSLSLISPGIIDSTTIYYTLKFWYCIYTLYTASLISLFSKKIDLNPSYMHKLGLIQIQNLSLSNRLHY